MQIEAFEPAGSTGIGCTATLAAAAVTTSSIALVDPAGRGQINASNKVRVFNSTDAVAFVRFTKGASSATAADMPVAGGATQVFKISPQADTASAILAAAATDSTAIYFTVGDGLG